MKIKPVRCFGIVTPVFLSTRHHTPSGIPIFQLSFESTGPAIYSTSEGEAIILAKQLGYKCPIIQEITPHETA